MKCSDVYLYICTNLDQNLNSARCRRIKKHIAGCADCSAYLDSLRKTVSLYRVYPTAPMPRSVHRRLFKVIHKIEKETPKGVSRRSRTRTRTGKQSPGASRSH